MKIDTKQVLSVKQPDRNELLVDTKSGTFKIIRSMDGWVPTLEIQVQVTSPKPEDTFVRWHRDEATTEDKQMWEDLHMMAIATYCTDTDKSKKEANTTARQVFQVN